MEIKELQIKELLGNIRQVHGPAIEGDAREMAEAEWLEHRMKGIGGSEAGKVIGLSKWGSPLEVWGYKTGQVEAPDLSEKDAVKFGKRAEAMIREWVQEEFAAREGAELETYESPFLYADPNYPFLKANIDGLCFIRGDYQVVGYGGLEIKTTTERSAKEWEDDSLPDDYYTQVQHYMMVLDLDWFLVVVLIGRKLEWRLVPRNPAFIDAMRDREIEFWKDCIEGGMMPAPTGIASENDALTAAFSNVRDESLELGGEYEKWTERYLAIQDQVKALDAEKKELQAKLKAGLGEYKTGIVGDHKITWSRFSQSRFDSTAFKKENPDLYEKYQKESQSGRFIVK